MELLAYAFFRLGNEYHAFLRGFSDKNLSSVVKLMRIYGVFGGLYSLFSSIEFWWLNREENEWSRNDVKPSNYVILHLTRYCLLQLTYTRLLGRAVIKTCCWLWYTVFSCNDFLCVIFVANFIVLCVIVSVEHVINTCTRHYPIAVDILLEVDREIYRETVTVAWM